MALMILVVLLSTNLAQSIPAFDFQVLVSQMDLVLRTKRYK